VRDGRAFYETNQPDSTRPAFSGRSEPRSPDLALLRPRLDFYAAEHPGPSDILLLVEVADTSVELEREVKVPLYAPSTPGPESRRSGS
jgi:hypothetical protein